MVYSYEYKHEKVAKFKKDYEDKRNKYLKNVVNPNYSGNLDEDLIEVKQLYKLMVDALDKAIIEDYTRGG